MLLKNIFDKAIQEYTGPTKTFRFFGGPGNFAKILTYPGSSKLIKSICYDYDYDFGNMSAVSIGTIFELKKRFPDEDVICTSALTTNRPRKGENHAYIFANKVYYIKFSRQEWNEVSCGYVRDAEDYALASIIAGISYIKDFNPSNIFSNIQCSILEV